MRCPVAVTLLSHPAVVAFYRDHGVDVRERPVWNVGAEWRERLVSTDPWCVVVSTCLDGACLFLYVAGDGSVVETRRTALSEVEETGRSGSTDDGDDDPDGGYETPADSRDVPGDGAEFDSDDGQSDLDHASAADGATA